ncbi:uncharacterized protein LOC111469925 [Cucurbita maxima]|uniref:Uncharacterized protein LOC111469925 n=1 Tax=Cucurbita maxima TaxID=3661 RepID=A0A6J1I4Z7_CUCMA|nr:uncharacterized protein LOC111469925 [Cucurbita maxima]XP_022971165.1 uncharacterized protein LOC111469925 [Cucurbita maxima]
MGSKQLDLNQPFLSVRRVSSIETSSKANELARTDNRCLHLPVYKSELKSGPVSNPGSVPFVWEHSPGKPKDGSKSQTIGSIPRSAAPKQPPGTSSDSNHLCSTGGGDDFHSHKSIVRFMSLRETFERDSSFDSDNDGDETYLEANDTLSRSKSFSMNCSETGLSGLDGGDVKPSGTFLKDQQTHELMMGRFLPAAKALASETSQVVHHRKKNVQRVQQREARKIVEMDIKHGVNSIPTTLPSYYAPLNTHDEETSKDEDIDLDEPEYSATKARRFLARFCLSGSFGLRHRVPGMRRQRSAAARGVHLDSSPRHVQPSKVEGETKSLSSTSMESSGSCSSCSDANSNPNATVLGSLHHEKSSQDEISNDSSQDFVSFTSSETSNKVPKGSDFEQNTKGRNHCHKASARGKINLESARCRESSVPISSQLELSPPLPRSPSESWLKRSLSTIVLKLDST